MCVVSAIYAPPPGRSAIYYVPLALPFGHEQSGPEGRRAAQRGQRALAVKGESCFAPLRFFPA